MDKNNDVIMAHGCHLWSSRVRPVTSVEVPCNCCLALISLRGHVVAALKSGIFQIAVSSEDKQTRNQVLYPLVCEYSRHLTQQRDFYTIRGVWQFLDKCKIRKCGLLRTCSTTDVNSGLDSVRWVTVDSSTVLQTFYAQLNRYAKFVEKYVGFF